MAKKICKNCGYLGNSKKSSSFLGEISIWIIFIFLSFLFLPLILIPIGYTLYRFFVGTKDICPSCKAQDTVVPIDSPIGKDLYNKYYSKQQ